MIKITPTTRPPGPAEFIEHHLIPLLLAFSLGMLVMDWRAEQAQADRTQALHDQVHRANSAATAAGAALNRVLVLMAQADDDCGAPAGVAQPDAGALLTRTTSVAGRVAGQAAGQVVGQVAP